MRLRLEDNACERRLMVTPQFFDPDELQILRSIMRPDFHFVDLGANVGTYSLFVGRLAGAGSRILAVEPQQSLVWRLQENITLNGLDVRVAPVAVGDREGTIEFAVDTNNLGFTSLHTQRRGRGEHRVVQLPMRKLLGLVREHGFERIDALKADIEGARGSGADPLHRGGAADVVAAADHPRAQRARMAARSASRSCASAAMSAFRAAATAWSACPAASAPTRRSAPARR